MYLCCLHNFCINVKDEDTLQTSHKDATYAVQFMDALHNRADNCITSNATLQRLDRGIPNGLLHGGVVTFMIIITTKVYLSNTVQYDMMAHVKYINLARPMSTR